MIDGDACPLCGGVLWVVLRRAWCLKPYDQGGCGAFFLDGRLLEGPATNGSDLAPRTGAKSEASPRGTYPGARPAKWPLNRGPPLLRGAVSLMGLTRRCQARW